MLIFGRSNIVHCASSTLLSKKLAAFIGIVFPKKRHHLVFGEGTNWTMGNIQTFKTTFVLALESGNLANIPKNRGMCHCTVLIHSPRRYVTCRPVSSGLYTVDVNDRFQLQLLTADEKGNQELLRRHKYLFVHLQ